MLNRLIIVLLLLLAAPAAFAGTGQPDTSRDILVTFENKGASVGGAGMGAPYRNRKRYTVARHVRSHARSVAREYALTEIDHWPIRSLDVYCFVYRIADSSDRDAVIEQLRADKRIESVQMLQEFETSTATAAVQYDDTYASLQHGLTLLDIGRAHRYSRGEGIRVAVIDGDVDIAHEDLRGRVAKHIAVTSAGRPRTRDHGTAVASVIAAVANNAIGIVGIAPESELEIYVSCWQDADADKAICDSFTLAKAIDSLLEDPPHILNLSLTGPSDPLLERLLVKVVDAGVIAIAATAMEPASGNHFPASLDAVIGVASSGQGPTIKTTSLSVGSAGLSVYAPGDQILVASPDDTYGIRSGSSLAAAHVSGVVALLLAVSPRLDHAAVARLLHESQLGTRMRIPTVNACRILHLADHRRICSAGNPVVARQNDN